MGLRDVCSCGCVLFLGSEDIDGEKREGDRRRDREEVVEET